MKHETSNNEKNKALEEYYELQRRCSEIAAGLNLSAEDQVDLILESITKNSTEFTNQFIRKVSKDLLVGLENNHELREIIPGPADKQNPDPSKISSNQLAHMGGVLQFSKTAIFILNADAKCVFMNSVAEELYNTKLSEFANLEYGKRTKAIYDMNGRKLDKSEYPFEVIKKSKKEFLNFKQCVEMLNGRVFYSSVNAYPILSENGDFNGVFYNIEDLTKEVETESRFRHLFNTSIDPLLVLSFDDDSLMQIIEANTAFSELHGYSIEELKTMNISEIDTPEHAAKIPERVKTIREKGRHRFEVSHHSKSGDILHFDVTATVSKLGNQTFGLSVMRDISEKKRAQKEQEKLTRRLITATEAAGMGIWERDFETNEVFWDEKTYELWGLKLEAEVNVKDFVDQFIHPDDLEEVNRTFYAALNGNDKSYNADFRIYRADSGELRYMQAFVIFFRDSKGKALRLTGINADITAAKLEEQHRMAIEKQMLQTQKLESLGVMAGGIAHDFNNLLVAILGNVQIAKIELEEKNQEINYLDEVELQAHRASDLCKQMLAYSGVGKFQNIPVEINELILEMKKLIGVSISKRVNLDFDLNQDKLMISGDPTQIRQVVLNLIINASDAMDDKKGNIILTSGVINFDQESIVEQGFNFFHEMEPGDYVFFTVKDTGEGMSNETLERIFEPFYTTKFTGRGLGLAAVIGIIKSHHGAIKVESEPSVGSLFTVYIPQFKDSQEREPEKEETPTPNQETPSTILIIDDEESVVKVCNKILNKRGHTILSSYSGEHGIKLYEDNWEQIDLILLDMTMPELNGTEVLEKILEINSKAKVIIMSGYHEQAICNQFSEGQIAGFLQKPFTVKLLTRLVRKSLQ